MAEERWTQKEFEVVVKKYCNLWKMRNICDSDLINKFADECVSELNGSRDRGSVKMRFQNISHVFNSKMGNFIEGCKPWNTLQMKTLR
jgi:hypothetical protein